MTRHADDGWSARVGDEAARLIRRATTVQRAGGIAGLLFVVLEVAFELDGFYRPGIEASTVFLAAMMVGLGVAIRLTGRARRLIAVRLGMPAKDAKWVRLRYGPARYDAWLACRAEPEWPQYVSGGRR